MKFVNETQRFHKIDICQALFHKTCAIRKIINALKADEIDLIRISPFRKWVEIAEKLFFLDRFGRLIISRQLKEVKKAVPFILDMTGMFLRRLSLAILQMLVCDWYFYVLCTCMIMHILLHHQKTEEKAWWHASSHYIYHQHITISLLIYTNKQRLLLQIETVDDRFPITFHSNSYSNFKNQFKTMQNNIITTMKTKTTKIHQNVSSDDMDHQITVNQRVFMIDILNHGLNLPNQFKN
ncbi:hypothetical protein YC2023_088901 [Brassica napus]